MVARSHGGWLALVPVKALPRGKSRLADVLDGDARADLVLFLLRRVVGACLEAGLDGLRRLAGRRGARGGARARRRRARRRRARSLRPASRSRSSATPTATGVVVLAADLPHVTADDVRELMAHARPLALVAAADGTTNAIAACPPTRVPARATAPAARRATAARALRLAGIERDVDTPGRPRARARRMPRVTVLAGGVGGARFARGLLACLPAARRDDRRQRRRRPRALGPLDLARPRHAALHADRPHPSRAGLGRGRRHARGDGASWPSSAAVDWFILGDRDIGLHLVRSERLRAGEPLSARDRRLRAPLRAGGPPAARRPTTACARASSRRAASSRSRSGSSGTARPTPCSAVRFEGVPGARPAPGVLEAIASADRIVLAPSNPFVSLDPILAVDGVRAAVEARRDARRRDHADDRRRGRQGPARGHARDARARGLRRRRRAACSRRSRPRFVLDSADEARARTTCARSACA